MQKSVVLVGIMGAGKTMVSNSLANHLHCERISTDEMVEKKEGRTIAAIFQESGEPYFRQLEEQVVREVSQLQGWVVDCGGGVVINPKNIANLRKNGILVYLKTSPEVAYQRIKNQSHRPLLKVQFPLDKIEELVKSRKRFYEKADFIIDTDQLTVQDTVTEVLKILPNE